jgi:hypothetical protein
MSSKPKAELEQALNSYLSNRSPQNIVASANSTRKIVDLVRGGVAVPGPLTVQELETTASQGAAPEEPSWMETLRNLAERCNPQPVENSGRVVNQLTKVSELIPGLVDQLATLANQHPVTQPLVVNHPPPSEQAKAERPTKEETLFRSRKDRRLTGIRISAEKLEKYELWCMITKSVFRTRLKKR